MPLRPQPKAPKAPKKEQPKKQEQEQKPGFIEKVKAELQKGS